MTDTQKAAPALNTGAWDPKSVTTLSAYDPKNSDATVAELMATLNRSKRSIVGKLVSMQVYSAPEKAKTERKDPGPTKDEILSVISNTGYDTDGLDGATKVALKNLQDFIASQS